MFIVYPEKFLLAEACEKSTTTLIVMIIIIVPLIVPIPVPLEPSTDGCVLARMIILSVMPFVALPPFLFNHVLYDLRQEEKKLRQIAKPAIF